MLIFLHSNCNCIANIDTKGAAFASPRRFLMQCVCFLSESNRLSRSRFVRRADNFLVKSRLLEAQMRCSCTWRAAIWSTRRKEPNSAVCSRSFLKVPRSPLSKQPFRTCKCFGTKSSFQCRCFRALKSKAPFELSRTPSNLRS